MRCCGSSPAPVTPCGTASGLARVRPGRRPSGGAAAASSPEPQPEYLAYLGWPLLITVVCAAVLFWRDRRVRLTAVTFALLELFSLGVVTVTFYGIRYPAPLLPWHWLQSVPVLADVLPDRFSILADGPAGACPALAPPRARGPRPPPAPRPPPPPPPPLPPRRP